LKEKFELKTTADSLLRIITHEKDLTVCEKEYLLNMLSRFYREYYCNENESFKKANDYVENIRQEYLRIKKGRSQLNQTVNEQ